LDAAGAFVEPVFNIEVDGDHVYRVGEQGLLVHNQSTDPNVECAVASIPNGYFYRGSDMSGVKEFKSWSERNLGEAASEKEYRRTLDDPAYKERILQKHAVSNGESAFISVSKDKRVAWVFATDSNTRGGYIYVIDTTRAEENRFNSKKTRLPNGVFIPEQEWVVPIIIRSDEIRSFHMVTKVIVSPASPT
jgi:hypothetical protein